jgi:hypothetical protein
MKELKEYRKKLIERLAKSARAFREACLAVQDPFAPAEENGWTVHQLAVHTRDVDKLAYGLRARRTAVENDPTFPNFDGEAYLRDSYQESEPLSEVLDELVASVEDLTELLRSLPDEGWSRTSRHTMLGGGLTLQSWVEKDLGHIEEHLKAVKQQNQK